MNLTARDVMQTDVQVVEPDATLPELERAFLEKRLSGFPVVQEGKLCGVVTRSDIIRQLCIEQSRAEWVSDYFHGEPGCGEQPGETFEDISDRVGQRIEKLHVRDVMSEKLITVSPDQTLQEVARALVDGHIHRVLVTEGDRLLGIVSNSDLAKLFADGRAQITS